MISIKKINQINDSLEIGLPVRMDISPKSPDIVSDREIVKHLILTELSAVNEKEMLEMYLFDIGGMVKHRLKEFEGRVWVKGWASKNLIKPFDLVMEEKVELYKKFETEAPPLIVKYDAGNSKYQMIDGTHRWHASDAINMETFIGFEKGLLKERLKPKFLIEQEILKNKMRLAAKDELLSLIEAVDMKHPDAIKQMRKPIFGLAFPRSAKREIEQEFMANRINSAFMPILGVTNTSVMQEPNAKELILGGIDRIISSRDKFVKSLDSKKIVEHLEERRIRRKKMAERRLIRKKSA